MALSGLDLFSGIGGGALALSGYVRPIAYCEIELYARGVLLSRIADGRIPNAPIWDDVTTLGRLQLGAPVDIIYGGFPCQDISVAGRGAGLEGKRSGLVSHVFRLVDELQPSFVFLENSPAIRTRGAEAVGKALTARGFDCRWLTLSAQEVGAPHIRNRWWLLAAHPERISLRDEQQRLSARRADGIRDQGEAQPLVNGCQGAVADADAANTASRNGRAFLDRVAWLTEPDRQSLAIGVGHSPGAWSVEPNVGRVADGIPARVDRLRGLGNAWVPLQGRVAFERLMGL